jgi:UDP-N-acetylglucosamine--N-acetylmuramyl-(pentapeptide) pyrophosphoryl-undecaprenol N-acetylglucosamine transferase
MGSFTSIPAILAAKRLGIPIFLHDGNAFIGKANRFLSRFAVKTALAFPPVNAETLKSPYEVTGMPLRPEISPQYAKKKYTSGFFNALNRKFNITFSSSNPTVLIFGGSQGASTFNSTIPETLKNIPVDKLQVIHITGTANRETVMHKYADSKCKLLVIEHTDEMALLYSAADFVICRAGGSTVAELALFAKSAILIPYPHATDNHQLFNAEYYLKSGNSVIIRDSECSSAKFRETLKAFIDSKDRKNNTETLSCSTDAAENLIRTIVTSSAPGNSAEE